MLAKTLVFSALAASAVSANPIERRGGTGTSIFGTYFASLIKGALGGKTNACNNVMQDGEKWYYIEGDDGNGNTYTTCWMEGVDAWDQATADAAKCLTNLHFTQANVCIDVKGSECDNGFIDNGGRLQSSVMGLVGSGYQKRAQITSGQSIAFQAAINDLVGQQVKGNGGKGPFIYVTTTEDGEEKHAPEMKMTFIGENDC
ncbi:hypothetical protein ACHAPU_009738 [Fusarium lateritium]